jgi:hypothetical protein
VDLVVAVVDGSTQVVIIMVEMAAMVDPLTQMESTQIIADPLVFLPVAVAEVGEPLVEQHWERIEAAPIL